MKIEIHELVETLQQAEKAHKLLEEFWITFGPYGIPAGLPDKVWYQVQNYFKFNDGE
jgi:hypothetical protein